MRHICLPPPFAMRIGEFWRCDCGAWWEVVRIDESDQGAWCQVSRWRLSARRRLAAARRANPGSRVLTR